MSASIALIGDRDDSVTAHRAIPQALALEDPALQLQWLPTPAVHDTDLGQFNGLWCVPASPYVDTAGALCAIRYARESGTPFFGSCGGYQYAALEFARHVLGLHDADNTETHPDTPTPLINSLSCALIDTQSIIALSPGSRIAQMAGAEQLTETYRCAYGVNRDYLASFDGSDLEFCGFDQDGDPRVFLHRTHPFFLGTAFQSERAALSGHRHPLVKAFVHACQQHTVQQHTVRNSSSD